MPKPFVAVVMGSNSDLPTMRESLEILARLAIPHEVRIASAHRTPAATQEYVSGAEARGCAVYIAAAGLAAHLAGAVAAHTTRPVVGVPLDAGPLRGIDALLSTVQMPGGVPVACMAIGKAGARNAAYLAAQILALGDAALARRLHDERLEIAATVADQNEALRRDLQAR